jgi:hypothetical protein
LERRKVSFGSRKIDFLGTLNKKGNFTYSHEDKK